MMSYLKFERQKMKNIPTKFHPDAIWNDFFSKRSPPNEKQNKKKVNIDRRSVPDPKTTTSFNFAQLVDFFSVILD